MYRLCHLYLTLRLKKKKSKTSYQAFKTFVVALLTHINVTVEGSMCEAAFAGPLSRGQVK